MKREQALRIARNLIVQSTDLAIARIEVERMEPAGGRMTVAVDAVNEEGENERYEVEIDPTSNAVALKKIAGSYSLDEYLNEPTTLSKLRPGQLFKMKYDCVVYEYYRTCQTPDNKIVFTFSRRGQRDISTSVNDIEVFPIG